MNSKFSSKNLTKMVNVAAMAYRPLKFKDLYGKIRATNCACEIYLGKIGVAQ